MVTTRSSKRKQDQGTPQAAPAPRDARSKRSRRSARGAAGDKEAAASRQQAGAASGAVAQEHTNRGPSGARSSRRRSQDAEGAQPFYTGKGKGKQQPAAGGAAAGQEQQQETAAAMDRSARPNRSSRDEDEEDELDENPVCEHPLLVSQAIGLLTRGLFGRGGAQPKIAQRPPSLPGDVASQDEFEQEMLGRNFASASRCGNQQQQQPGPDGCRRLHTPSPFAPHARPLHFRLAGHLIANTSPARLLLVPQRVAGPLAQARRGLG